jgi:long-subunit acyl-CoA synthetase (AMP-forming)
MPTACLDGACPSCRVEHVGFWPAGKALHLVWGQPCGTIVQVEDDVVTPSMKLKRPQLQKKYQKEIDAL